MGGVPPMVTVLWPERRPQPRGEAFDQAEPSLAP